MSSVIIVGPSGRLKDQKIGDKIDEFDIVCRINWGGRPESMVDENKEISINQINDKWIIYRSENLNLKNKSGLNLSKIKSKEVKLNEIFKINFLNSFNKVSFLGLGWTSYKSSIEPWTDGSYSSLIFDLSNVIFPSKVIN